MSAERAYRRLLLTYPKRWREVHGEEALSVLMDAAEARERHRPSAADAADLLGHGLLARLALATGRLDARARETAAVLAMASLTALLLLTLLMGEWWPWPAGGPDAPLASWPGTPGPFHTLGGPVVAAAIGVPVLVLLGRPRAARAGLAIVLPALALLPAATAVLDLRRPALWTLAALVAFGLLSLAAPVRHRGRFAGLAAMLSAAVLLAVWSGTAAGYDPRSDFYYGNALLPVLATGPYAVALAAAFAAGRRALLAPVVLVGACWLGLFAARAWHGDGTYAVVSLVGAAMLASLALIPTARVRFRLVVAGNETAPRP
jgi:hypothetical protein